MGVVAALSLTLLMGPLLSEFETSEAGRDSKLASAVRNKFGFDSVGALVRQEGKKKVLWVSYLTLKDSKLIDEVQKKEMAEVAKYAISEYQGRDKSSLHHIAITRKERHGSGCWQHVYTNSLELPNPEKGKWIKIPGGKKRPRLLR